MLFRVNGKGFNLFSALVAMVLIIIGVLLVNMMVFREANTRTQIYSMKENFGLADAANIARADAIQSFSHYFRRELEMYLTSDGSESAFQPLLKIRKNPDGQIENNFENWGDVVKEFETQILLTPSGSANNEERYKAVARFVALNIINKFGTGQEGTYGRYRVSLSELGTPAQKKVETAFSNAIKKVLDDPTHNIQTFFEIVDCDNTACPVGTFYFNFPLDQMSTEDYENLPRIVVSDTHTGEKIQIPLLPQEKLRIYIPIRFLKAAYEARRVAMEYNDLGIGDELKSYRLGFCEYGVCGPRNNPATPAPGDRENSYCPESENDSPANKEKLLGPATLFNLDKYTVGGEKPGDLELEASAIGELANNFSADPGSPGNPCSPSGGCDFVNETIEKNDFFTNPGNGPIGVDGFPFKYVSTPRKTYITKTIQGTGSDYDPAAGKKLYCTQINSVSIKMLFREKNKNYILNGESGNGENLYGIEFTDDTFAQEPDRTGEFCINDKTANSGTGRCYSG
ncbi:MAG: hypothetical protein NTZ73_01340 [Candidatus Diapherotrites archaeon]|nr:hypothetical protein [Candidatus Diapherotrites archaeon]